MDLDDYGIVNLCARLTGENYEFYAFAQNVFDEAIVLNAFPFGTTPAGEIVSTGSVGQPRLFGVGVKAAL